jgi:hypothetical protein
MQVGNFGGKEPTRSHEERTHFSLWAINSAPLVLGFDMGNATHMDRVWPWITNPDSARENTPLPARWCCLLLPPMAVIILQLLSTCDRDGHVMRSACDLALVGG